MTWKWTFAGLKKNQLFIINEQQQNIPLCNKETYHWLFESKENIRKIKVQVKRRVKDIEILVREAKVGANRKRVIEWRNGKTKEKKGESEKAALSSAASWQIEGNRAAEFLRASLYPPVSRTSFMYYGEGRIARLCVGPARPHFAWIVTTLQILCVWIEQSAFSHLVVVFFRLTSSWSCFSIRDILI